MRFPPPRSLLLVPVTAILLVVLWSVPVRASSPLEAQDIVRLINDERAANGLRPLTLEPRLSAAAQRHSDDMAAHDFVSHTGSDGSSYWDRVTQAGYAGQIVGEVITAGQSSTNDVVNAWINSPTHHAIILVP